MGAAATTLRWASGPAETDGALALRELVFCGEQGVPVEEEIDGRDGDALHLLALASGDGEVVGTLRLLFDGDTVKVGRVAVRREWRRRGIASEMLRMALGRARELGSKRARLAAQVEAVAVYSQAGFEVCSGEFEEAGILHVWMEQAL